MIARQFWTVLVITRLCPPESFVGVADSTSLPTPGSLPRPHEEMKSNSPSESGQPCDLLVTNKRQHMWHYELIKAHELLPSSLEDLCLEFWKKPDHLGLPCWEEVKKRGKAMCGQPSSSSPSPDADICMNNLPDIKTHFESGFESSQLRPQHHGAETRQPCCVFFKYLTCNLRAQ